MNNRPASQEEIEFNNNFQIGEVVYCIDEIGIKKEVEIIKPAITFSTGDAYCAVTHFEWVMVNRISKISQ